MTSPYPPYPPYPPFPPFPPYAPYGSGAGQSTCAGVPTGSTPLPPAAVPPAQTDVRPPARPQQQSAFPGMNAGNPLSIYFNFDSPLLVDQTAEGVGTAQSARLQQFAQQARGANATAVVVNGYASPEGQEAHNATLARNRANSVRDRLAGLLPGVALTVGTTGELPGSATSYPSLRRADVFITAPAL